MTNTDIVPFSIAIAQAELDDLQYRLDHARFEPPLPGTEPGTEPGTDRGPDASATDDWSTGVPVAYLRELVDYWRTHYDWRAEEAKLNTFEQFTTVIEGQSIHFLHVRSGEPDAVALVLTHGWPGSFVEFLDLVGPLTDPVAHGGRAEDAFDVVIPSIPGFGFSSPVTGPNWGTERIAGAWLELMTRLGYERFGVQGGDLGSAISPEIARLAPDRVIGVHVNGSLGMPVWAVSDEEKASLTELERDRVARVEAFMREEYGYISIQSTRPQTLGAGLTDSPVGQLAWIVDKFREWTFPRAALPDAVVGRDRLLTNVMLYWLTRTGGSAAWIGYAQLAAWGAAKAVSGVPTAGLMLAHDVGIRRYAERENRITRWTDVDVGGHFAALEQPGILVDDLRAFFAPLRASR
ncbi:epoxide hydrolase family protein [Subtercola endophyticus]|uniref:epoxide hydrolase family protein n=1 Tax=Subtercola endophyticus TaxID=2895559 RepID=UPI001E371173|nr:epoxide hydrolase family protein [Subtercola endophyticus]UFS58257.1 epoxide hydrolase [Subtercola endophyticus]